MTHLLRGELIKLRSTRTAFGFAAAAVLLVLAVVLVIALAGEPESAEDKADALNVGGTLSVVLILFGIVGATGEFRHRTLAPTLLIAPDRVRSTGARVLAYGLAGLLVGALMLVVAFAVGLPLLTGEGPEPSGSDYGRLVVGGLLTSALSAMLGVGVGVLVGNQVAAVVGALVWLFILEPLVGLVEEDATPYTLGTVTSAAGGSDQGLEDVLSWGAALAVLALWAVLFVAAGTLLDRRRDVS
jgi:ABC-2 type transport system permease protein